MTKAEIMFSCLIEPWPHNPGKCKVMPVWLGLKFTVNFPDCSLSGVTLRLGNSYDLVGQHTLAVMQIYAPTR